MLINPTQETLAMMKSSLGMPLDNSLKKGVTTSTGLTYYDLQAPAKNLYPVITPLRNKLPRKHRPNSGTATNWKQVSAITGPAIQNIAQRRISARSEMPAAVHRSFTRSPIAQTTIGHNK